MSHLSKLFLGQTSTQTSSAVPETSSAHLPPPIDLTTVLGWKNALEKIEQAAPYWLREEAPQRGCP
ncbi:unnamed protein product [Heligmosomoides polygyrus]|uniref:Uncharacterized protein n=1 Tax=Heligmosomoides polygyrus TaxID=6339 RepID=A0A3P7U608_HELPZ|nr:unnamed protein product [Heligmosomoides polygyrus]